MMLDYFKGDPLRIESNMPYLEKMFEKLARSPFNHQIVGELAYLVLGFLDEHPSQIKSNKSIVERIVFESLDSPNLSIKLGNILGDFLTKYQNKCGFTG